VLNFNYNTGLDSNISRLSSISDSGNTLESYKYLGLSTVIERDHPQNNVNLTYVFQTGDGNANHDGGDQYTGLDRFGRVIDQNWLNTSTSTSTDRFQYGYDRNSNVLYKQNLVDTALSDLYAYDNLDQLTSFQRGTLNSTKTGLTGSASRSQSWSPDALGNFTSVTTNGTAQTRTANQQNEITSIQGQGSVTYDANGNLTADGSGNTFVYDAWNRLVAVKNGGNTLAAYAFDGMGRRISETHGSTSTDLYYNAGWQVIEEKQNGQLQARNVWSAAGIDTLVLRDQSSQHNGVLDQRLYVQQDADGNVTALVDTGGNVVERYLYDPYGAVTITDANWNTRSSSSYGWLYFFQGKRYDNTVGLYDSRERVYSPTLMRPLQADPLGQGPDNNDYRWEGNGPIGAMDPSSLVDWKGMGTSLWEGTRSAFHSATFGMVDPQVVVDGYVAHETQNQLTTDMVATGDIGGAVKGYSAYVLGFATPLTTAPSLGPITIPSPGPYLEGLGNSLDPQSTARGIEAGHAEQVILMFAGPLIEGYNAYSAYSVGLRGLSVSEAEAEAAAVGKRLPCPPGNAPAELVNCFPPDTLVGTESGLRPMSQIGAGERVWGYTTS
jgi:RHS repeat-associated protein